jgi:hypothetical protein
MSGIAQAIRRLLSPSPQGMKMTDYATAEFTAQCKLDDANAALNDPPEGADIGALMAARDAAAHELKVALARKGRAADDAHRAAVAARHEAFRRDIDEPLAWLRANMPRVRFELIRLAEMERRLDDAPAPWAELTGGLPFGAAGLIQGAIARATAGSAWEEIWTPPHLQKILDSGRELVAKHQAQRAARAAEAQAEFDRKLAAFERGESREDPRIVTYRVRAGR